MKHIRLFFIKMLKGTSILLLACIPPGIAMYFTKNGAIIFVIWVSVTILFAIIMLLLRNRIKNWIWLIIVSASVILLAPIMGSYLQYVLFALLPDRGYTITEHSVGHVKNDINTYYIAKEARIAPYKELSLTETENYKVEDTNNPGQYVEKTNKREYHFIPIFWAKDTEEASFGLLEHNSEVKDMITKHKYNPYEKEPSKLPVLYLLPGTRALREIGLTVYHESKSETNFTLDHNYMVFNCVFFSIDELKEYVCSNLKAPLIFFVAVWFCFVVIPATRIAWRE